MVLTSQRFSGGLKKLKLVENSAETGHSRRYQTDAIWEY